jgi:hypothetical protein
LGGIEFDKTDWTARAAEDKAVFDAQQSKERSKRDTAMAIGREAQANLDRAIRAQQAVYDGLIKRLKVEADKAESQRKTDTKATAKATKGMGDLEAAIGKIDSRADLEGKKSGTNISNLITKAGKLGVTVKPEEVNALWKQIKSEDIVKQGLGEGETLTGIDDWKSQRDEFRKRFRKMVTDRLPGDGNAAQADSDLSPEEQAELERRRKRK